jgi:hypothetical protein
MVTRQITSWLVAAILVGLQTAQVSAQSGRPAVQPPPRPAFREHVWGPISSPTYVDVEPHHCSTAFEGAARGMGYFYRGLGAGLRDVAEGQVHLGLARQLALENHREAFYLWHEKRDWHAATKAARHANRLTPDEIVRLARQQRPRPLSAAELATDGTIQWPPILCEAPFAARRQAAQAAMSQLVVEGDAARALQLRQFLVAQCEAMQADLLQQAGKTSCSTYMPGRKFLESLRCELMHRAPMSEREYLARQ